MTPHIMSPSRFAGGISDTGLKTYHKFNESSGDIANKSTATASLTTNSDIQVTGATYGTVGILGTALSFDGVDDFAIHGTSLSQFNFMHNTTALFTISFWYKKGATLASDTRIWNDFTDSNAIGFGVNFGFGDITKLNCWLSAGSGNITAMTTTTAFLPADTNWHMVTVTYNQSLSSGNMICYIDGGSAQTFNKPAHPLVDTDSTYAGQLGRRPDGISFAHFDIDELSIWNKVLTSAEITSLYNGGLGKAIY